LSGGEKARLLLALTAFHGPHLLILDEPTNHLDVDSREALIHALMDYEGAVVLISHDRHLVEAIADRLWIVRNGTVRAYDGDMDTYRAELLAERGGKTREWTARGGALASANGRPSRADERRAAADRRAELAPLRKTMQNAEAAVAEITKAIAGLDELLADPALYVRNPKMAQDAGVERGILAKKLSEAEVAWIAATEAFEDAERAITSTEI